VQDLINLSDVIILPITFAKVVPTFSSWTVSVIVLQRATLLELISTANIISAGGKVACVLRYFYTCPLDYTK
jgi:hypothetical protein